MSQHGSRARSAISENRSLTIIILSYIALLAARRSDFFVCAVILNARLGKSVNSFNSLSINQAGSAMKSRSDGNDRRILSEKLSINFLKYYLEIYLICLRQPQIRNKC